jgi:hypothetical protein
MAVDIGQQAYQAVYQVIQKILGSREEAAGYAEDPKGYLAAEGVADYDLAGVNLQQVVQQACYDADVPGGIKQTVQQGYGGGGGGGGGGQYSPPPASAGPGQAPADHLIQHINYVTHVTYEGDDYITQQLINQENYDYSTNVNLEGNFAGDVNLDASSVIASGDGAVAAGRDAEGVATGDGAVAAGRDIEGAVNTGQFTGIQAGGDVSDTNLNIGGEQTNIQNSDITNSAIGGGDVQNVEINADDGAAVAFGEGAKAEGSRINVDAQDSNVQVGDGAANQNLDQSENFEQNVEQNIDAYNSQIAAQTGAAGEDLYQEQDLGGFDDHANGGNGIRQLSESSSSSDDLGEGGL